MSCKLCDLNNLNKQKIFETKTILVIYNSWAATEGQCLVIPKRHVDKIRDLTSLELNHLMKTIQMVSKILESELNPIGFNYGFNEGYFAGQHINHFHFHIIPRFEGDNFNSNLILKPKIMTKLTKNELKAQVKRFKRFFEPFSFE